MPFATHRAAMFDLTPVLPAQYIASLAAIRRIETTLACAAVLITEHSQLALAITSQPV